MRAAVLMAALARGSVEPFPKRLVSSAIRVVLGIGSMI